MITISLCMIVKNEAGVLEHCLDSVQDLVDEIIIADTGSTDATREIAARYTNRVYDFEWADDFSAARNFSFSKAQKEFILWLDADDVLLDANRAAFRALRIALDSDTDVVMMRYDAAFDASGHPTLSYYRERLLRREKGFRWQGAVHEAITPSGKIIHAPITVTHRKTRPGDPERNLRIMEKLLANGKPLEPRQQYYYARELLDHGRYEQAAAQLESFLALGNGWVENNISACADLAECRKRMGQPQLAFFALTRSFLYDTPRPEICCALGAYFLEAGQLVQAVHWYRQALAVKPAAASGGFFNPDAARFLPLLQLCVCYDRLGQRERAYRCHRLARRLKPDDDAVRYNDAYFCGLGYEFT